MTTVFIWIVVRCGSYSEFRREESDILVFRHRKSEKASTPTVQLQLIMNHRCVYVYIYMYVCMYFSVARKYLRIGLHATQLKLDPAMLYEAEDACATQLYEMNGSEKTKEKEKEETTELQATQLYGSPPRKGVESKEESLEYDEPSLTQRESMVRRFLCIGSDCSELIWQNCEMESNQTQMITPTLTYSSDEEMVEDPARFYLGIEAESGGKSCKALGGSESPKIRVRSISFRKQMRCFLMSSH